MLRKVLDLLLVKTVMSTLFTCIAPGTKLFENDEVEFEVEDSERGPKAVSVSKLGSAGSEESGAPAEEAPVEEEKGSEPVESEEPAESSQDF